MSWEIALVVSSVLAAGAQYQAGKQQAKAGERRAELEAKQHKTNADLASLQALQQENDRISEWQMLDAANNASIDYDPYSSASSGALTADNEKNLERDIDNIQLMGMINQNRSLLSAESASIEASGFRSAGRYAWVKPLGTLTQGAYQASKVSTPTATPTATRGPVT